MMPILGEGVKYIVPIGKIHTAKTRGDEVRQWIETIGYEGRYACLDDDADFYPEQNLVRTTYDEGLTELLADLCIDLLKGSADSETSPSQRE